MAGAKAELRAWVRTGAGMLAISLVLTGCGPGRPGHEEGVEVARPSLQEGLFALAAARVSEGPPPARFAADLPATVAAFRSESTTLPTAFFEKRLCAGDREVVARLGRAVEAASKHASPDELRETYGSLLAYCGRREMCVWTRDAVDQGGPLGEVSWVGLAQCAGAENDSLFESDRAPARQLIEYWGDRAWTGPAFAHRFIPAVVTALRHAVDSGDVMLVRRAAIFLGEGGEPNGVAALVAIHGELPASKLRDGLTVGLVEATAPAAKAIVAELCGRPGRKDPMCDRDQVSMEMLTLGVDSPDQAPAPEPTPSPEEASAMKTKLTEVGILWRGPLGFVTGGDDLESTPRNAEEWLVASGPVHCFDVETGMFPNEHDALLFELAELAGPPLSSALFEESPPPILLEEGKWLVDGQKEVNHLPAGAAETDPYRLRAFLDGRVFEVDAQNFGDWYDLDQVIGLLNAIAIDRKAEVRVVVLPARDQTACVLAAPRTAILAGASAGLLEIGDSGAARKAGQGFEAEVFQKLKSGEISFDSGN